MKTLFINIGKVNEDYCLIRSFVIKNEKTNQNFQITESTLKQQLKDIGFTAKNGLKNRRDSLMRQTNKYIAKWHINLEDYLCHANITGGLVSIYLVEHKREFIRGHYGVVGSVIHIQEVKKAKQFEYHIKTDNFQKEIFTMNNKNSLVHKIDFERIENRGGLRASVGQKVKAITVDTDQNVKDSLMEIATVTDIQEMVIQTQQDELQELKARLEKLEGRAAA
ncbi:hypothetical protein AN944_03411 [Shewanella sp. P1-14-1]|uniref:hypothetical protein n=1 Tax=Shewanella sp. P1-14-1 TaxID=1723761 RepID=UPI0006D67245|nr:hypothetical protein [Shewanella sp. P1-14-1]KPZ68786.1 hypothetical protein AN944_03411 [Shewanella sp. P1-14-1]